jgi:hypothetical protein
MSIFQKSVTSGKKDFMNREMSYDNTHFYCPRVYAKDGFNVSLQIHYGNYCSSENGYRELGHSMQTVEFGFPSANEEAMFEYAEGYGCPEYIYDEVEGHEIPFDISKFDITEEVGSIPLDVMEAVFKKHGGIDWEKTISVEYFNGNVL